MKFDFIVGNPPYQDNTLGDNETYAPPIYHKFMDAAYAVGDRVELIHPARFLFNAGSTPKAWNEKMLSDPHFTVLRYEENAQTIFKNTEIKGGVAITYRNTEKDYGAIKIFTKYKELNSILQKVLSCSFVSFSGIVITRTAYRLTDKVHKDYPNAITQLSNGHPYDMSTNIFERLPQIFYDNKPNDAFDYIQILGRLENRRKYKYVRRDYVNNVINLDKYKIYIPKASGVGAFGEIITSPIIEKPGIGATETFVGIGAFDDLSKAVYAQKYIRTKFVRALLGVLKTTQDITPEKWKYVPLQDFSCHSDINWTLPVAEIDAQLYKKYGLSYEEIRFIEDNVKEMN